MPDEVTVIVVALIGGEALDACVRAVRSQSAKFLVVRRDGTIVDGEGRPVGVADRADIPAKRRSAAELATSPLIALIEDTVVPQSSWARAVADAFSRKEVVACGGPVIIADHLPAQTRALTLSEYAQYNDRVAAGEISALPGCNFAFRRDALLEAMRGSDGLVDLPVFGRLRELDGKLVWAPDAAVTFSHPYPNGARLKTRFDHGRIYASSKAGAFSRAVTAAKSFLLPVVLTARVVKDAGLAQLRSIRTLGWLILQHMAWASGEFVGAVAGPSPKGLGEWQ